MATVAMSGQRMIDAFGRLQGLPKCRALAANLTAGRFAGGLAQGTGLLGQAIGRLWLARIAAVLVDLRFERLKTRQQRQNEDVLLFVRQPSEVRNWKVSLPCQNDERDPNCLQLIYGVHRG